VTEPTSPVTEATTPVTEPTSPVTEPTTPVTEPTSPVTEPTTPVTEPPLVFELPEPGQPTWTVPLEVGSATDRLTMNIVSNTGDIAVYDGAEGDIRCVGVVGPGSAYTGWCDLFGSDARFVADRGVASLLVEAGVAVGDVTVVEQAPTWSLPSNGCSAPVSVLLAPVQPGPRPVMGLVCAEGEAFVGIGSVFFGEVISPDGGGILIGDGTEGWDTIGGFGTSIDCGGWPDGVDRCALFGVESELFEALLPIPPGDATSPSEGVIEVVDRTDEVRGWLAGVTDPAGIEATLRDQLDDPEAEVPARIAWAIGPGAQLDLLIVEVPQFDDAFRSESWAVWVAGGTVVRATSWLECARGVSGGLCV
jgi:hypothetical protein